MANSMGTVPYYEMKLMSLVDKELKKPAATAALTTLREMEMTLILNLETFSRTPVKLEEKAQADARKAVAQEKIQAVRSQIQVLESAMRQHQANVEEFTRV